MINIHRSLKPKKCGKCSDETWYSEKSMKEHLELIHPEDNIPKTDKNGCSFSENSILSLNIISLLSLK